MRAQVGHDHYFNKCYDSKERFMSYWHQINEIIRLNPKRTPEIGIGNGFISKYLKERGINIMTLDIDRKLNPDVIGSVLQMPFGNDSFDAIACYEVLEHLPYSNFSAALAEIFRVSKSHVILSLPDINRAYRFNVQIPKICEIRKLIPLPRLRRPIHNFDGEHYWEIGKSGYPLSRIIGDIQKAGFELEDTYRVFEHPYHRFLKLLKTCYLDKNKLD